MLGKDHLSDVGSGLRLFSIVVLLVAGVVQLFPFPVCGGSCAFAVLAVICRQYLPAAVLQAFVRRPFLLPVVGRQRDRLVGRCPQAWKSSSAAVLKALVPWLSLLPASAACSAAQYVSAASSAAQYVGLLPVVGWPGWAECMRSESGETEGPVIHFA